jgi:WD40 repeat protein
VVNPHLSPDGSQVVFFGSTTEDLFLFDLATSRLRRLTDDDKFFNRHPQWTETGWILYSSDREGSWDVWAIRPDGSDRTRLTESSDPEFLALWAPRIRQAWIRTITGDPLVRSIEEPGTAGPPRLGPATPAPTCQGSRFFPLTLSPSGNRVIGFSSCGQARSAFWIHDLASGNFTHLFPLLPYTSPCWIDDDRLVLPGRDIVVVETSGEVLYREPVSPTDPIQVVRCNVTPDGTRLIMNAYSIESDVWLAELGGVE